MSPERLREIERVCEEALAMPLAERGAFLARACSDAEIRGEVESLLAAAPAARELFSFSGEIPPFEPLTDVGSAGPYEILEKLGEGAMGVVFRARQRSPVLRDVALKIIRPGLVSPQLLARFQLERQVLAMMDHPHIARVLDVGATSQGLPYMAMELVDGRPITQFCREGQLNVRERVELMIPVCQAIQHAHQKGIIHRDIKPSNVLVTVYDGRPAPKVIDFGIAKEIGSALGEMASGTRPGMMVGTFDYVSPEQAEPGSADVDTRTDIYSLGALLFQLLTGQTPLDGLSLERSSYAELMRRIREETPPAVSSRIKNLQAPELDWIVAKALEKDRERRYASADGMAQDLRRYLEGEPVEAGPPSLWYRARKFATRHRWGLGVAATVAASLIVAVVWMSIALRQQQRANVSTQALRDVVRKIIVERPAQLARMPNRTALRAELMRDAEGALDVLSRDASSNDVASRRELAQAYLAIGKAKGPFSSQGSEGDPAGAAVYLRKATELFRRLAREWPEDIDIRRGEMDALSTWLGLQYRLRESVEGERTAREIEDEIGRMSPAMKSRLQANWYLSNALVELGAIRFFLGYTEEGLVLHRKASTMFDGALPPGVAEDPGRLDQLASVQRELAISIWMYAGFSEEVLTAARRGVAIVAACDAPQCRMRRAQLEGTLGEIEWAAGQRAQGIATMRRSVAAFEALASEDVANAVYVHSGSIVRNYLALALAKKGAGAEAVALAEQSVRSLIGADGQIFKGRERRMVHRITLGGALVGAKRFGDAERELRDTLVSNRDWTPNEDLRWSAQHLLTQALAAQGKFEEALRMATEARQLIDTQTNSGFSAAVLKAIAAADYAAVLARYPGSTAAERDKAQKALEARTKGLDSRYATLTGALLEAPPAAAEVAALQALLQRRDLR